MTRLIAIAAILGTIVLVSCGAKSSSEPTAEGPDGKGLFKQYCVICHGVRGDTEVAGAANLRESSLSEEEANDVITNGRNTMAPFKDLMSKKEIKAVTAYIQTLKDTE